MNGLVGGPLSVAGPAVNWTELNSSLRILLWAEAMEYLRFELTEHQPT